METKNLEKPIFLNPSERIQLLYVVRQLSLEDFENIFTHPLRWILVQNHYARRYAEWYG